MDRPSDLSFSISQNQLISALSEAFDLVSPAVTNHHKQVTYFAGLIARQIGVPPERIPDVVWAAMLHDVGAISLQERKRLRLFEAEGTTSHCEIGYRLLSTYPPFRNAAELVQFHHAPWRNGDVNPLPVKGLEFGNHIIHLADRISNLIDNDQEILGQVDRIIDKVKRSSGRMFHPEYVEAFEAVAHKEFIWLEATTLNSQKILSGLTDNQDSLLSGDELLSLGKMISYVIDFKSPFTATHSAGVATVAHAIAEFIGMTDVERLHLQTAGYLHDLGKLAIPTEILEKKAALSQEEFNRMRRHTFYTYNVLHSIAGMEQIKEYAAFHHERLDGGGYPFHLTADELPVGSRVLAVADVFTAISEDRPYRIGMSRDAATEVLQKMVSEAKLDGEIAAVLFENYHAINDRRAKTQQTVRGIYEDVLPSES